MILVLAGESASGKTTTAEEILSLRPEFRRVVTYTTRPMRKGEKDGVDYHFVDEETFRTMCDRGEFLETAQYRGWQYGTRAESLSLICPKVLILTPSGVRALRRYAKGKLLETHICVVYLQTDRRDRLIHMLSRGDDIEEATRRSLSDVGQFDGFADEADFVVQNAGFSKTKQEVAREVLHCADFFAAMNHGEKL